MHCREDEFVVFVCPLLVPEFPLKLNSKVNLKVSVFVAVLWGYVEEPKVAVCGAVVIYPLNPNCSHKLVVSPHCGACFGIEFDICFLQFANHLVLGVGDASSCCIIHLLAIFSCSR